MSSNSRQNIAYLNTFLALVHILYTVKLRCDCTKLGYWMGKKDRIST